MQPRMSGYNILVRNTSQADLARLKAHFQRNQPGISVVFLEPKYINELREVSPNTLYILRDAPQGHGTDDDIYDKIDPVSYVNFLHQRAPQGVALYLGNEPHKFDRIIQWTLAALDRCDQLGRRAVVLNLSPGRPEVAEWTTLFAPLLRRLHKSNHIMGLHEYWTKGRYFEPWWVGRAKFLYEACDSLGVTRPPIAYTEIGMLSMHPTVPDWLDPYGGWRKMGVSADEYADSLIDVYRVYEKQETVLGAAIFCVGTWNGCEVEPSPRLFERLEQYQPMQIPTPNPNPTNPPQNSIPKPANAGDPVNARVVATGTFDFINMRSGNSTDFEKRGEIRAGDTITYYPATKRTGGIYEWVYATKPNAEGWFAIGLLTLEPIKPDTKPVTDAFSVSAADLAQLDALNAQISAAQIQLNAAQGKLAEVLQRIRNSKP